MRAAVEEERKDSLQHLVGVEHILGTVLHQVLEGYIYNKCGISRERVINKDLK